MKNIVIGTFLLTSIVLINGGSIQQVTRHEELQNILKNNKIAVALFYLPSCPHCQHFKAAGIFKELAQKYPDVAFIEINADTAPTLAQRHGITGYPGFKIFHEGKPMHHLTGFQQRGIFERKIEELKKK